MDWAAIYARALRKAHTNANNYASTEANQDIDIVYQELVDYIVNVSKWDYFWDSGITNTVVWQSEYVAEKLGIDPNDLDIKKINKVFIKYSSTDTYYTKATYQNPGTLDKHPAYYKVSQNKAEPFFYIQDKSIFLYPAPTEAVTSGLELYVIHKPQVITISSTEADIELPTQFQYLIAYGMAISILEDQRKFNEAAILEQKYNIWVTEMTSFIKERYNQPKAKTITWLDENR